MDLEGTFHGGTIIPDDASGLMEGQRVRITIPDRNPNATFGERFARFKGVIDGLPEDLADQHDHYRLGTPKR